MPLPTKTDTSMVLAVTKVLGNFNVVQHPPTNSNPLGQSGVHTFATDLIDIVLNSSNESEAYRNLCNFFVMGSLAKDNFR